MPTLDDLNKKLVDLENALVTAGPKIAEELAINQLTMARDRIERRGVPGKSYSTKLMLATINMFSIRAKFKPTVIGN